MGKIGRFACIMAPMAFTLITVVCGLLLLVAGTSKNIAGLLPYYQIKIDTKNFQIPDSIDIIPGDTLGKYEPLVSTGVQKQEVHIDDFYYSYMWNYCSGDIEESDDQKTYDVKQCKSPMTHYAFDIQKIANDHIESNGEIRFPDSAVKAQKTLKVVYQFMVACYALAFAAGVITLFVGWFGLVSRWGSCVTTVFADTAFLFFFVASCCSTAISYTILATFNKAFEDFGVKATVGRRWMLTTWIGTAFAFAGALFWLMSTFCCSTRTSNIMSEKNYKNVKVKSTPYTYERVASPYPGAAPSPVGEAMHYKGKGREPMRHVQV